MNTLNLDKNLENLSNEIQTCTTNMNNGRRMAASLKLSGFKMKTMPILGKPRYLTSEEKVEVADLVHKMHENGWLTEGDRVWALENEIDID